MNRPIINMKVYYNDGEIETFNDVGFEGHDLESYAMPMLAAISFEKDEKQIVIMLDKVKKLEFDIIED